MSLYSGIFGECNVKISGEITVFFNLGKIFREIASRKAAGVTRHARYPFNSARMRPFRPIFAPTVAQVYTQEWG